MNPLSFLLVLDNLILFGQSLAPPRRCPTPPLKLGP